MRVRREHRRRDGETWLSWGASSDNATPTGLIVYEVYLNGRFDQPIGGGYTQTSGPSRISPLDQLPDLRLQVSGVSADLREDGHGELQVGHRLLAAAGVVEEVGEGVLEHRFDVPVPELPASASAAPASSIARSRSPDLASTRGMPRSDRHREVGRPGRP